MGTSRAGLVLRASVVALLLACLIYVAKVARPRPASLDKHTHLGSIRPRRAHLATSLLHRYEQCVPEVVQTLRDGSSLEQLERMMRDPRVEQQAQQAAAETIRVLQDPVGSRRMREVMADPQFLAQARHITLQATQAVLSDPQTVSQLQKMFANSDFQRHADHLAAAVAQISRGRTQATASAGRPPGAGTSAGQRYADLRPLEAAHAGLRALPRLARRLLAFVPPPVHLSRRQDALAPPFRADAVTPLRASNATEGMPGSAVSKKGVAAAGVLASSALISEAVQVTGTAVLLAVGQRLLDTNSPVETVAALISYIQSLGVAGYGAFSVGLVFLQVVPIAAAFILTVSSGAIFGAVKGTATVLTCSTLSATISFMIARYFGRDLVLEAAKSSKQFLAIDEAFTRANFREALTLVTLVRLSPVLPFPWANYAFGLTPVPPAAFSLGTFLGCFPAIAVYVTAGQAGADVAVNGPGAGSPLLLALGGAATFGAINVAGNMASKAVEDLENDLAEKEEKKKKNLLQ